MICAVGTASATRRSINRSGFSDGGGSNTLEGTDYADQLNGRSGNDTLDGGAGDDVLKGAAGDDDLSGNRGNDILLGGSGNDVLSGSWGKDWLDGQTGNGALKGGGSQDRLAGGTGDDYLAGGSSPDTFLFQTGWGVNTITDFDAIGRVHDTLDLSGLVSIRNWRDLQRNRLEADGDEIVIDGRNGDLIVLKNVDLADLDRGLRVLRRIWSQHSDQQPIAPNDVKAPKHITGRVVFKSKAPQKIRARRPADRPMPRVPGIA
ncbi:MAG: hypothetical protein KDK53_16230 [Maritimibacter sp.]|nr:hypothetical protein [Maritimibacter sp.]